uniref:Tyrosine-protein kinase n=1 Tax=Trichuris muris TaxID=70415 RepID=A0A5S6QDG2_TRIMR
MTSYPRTPRSGKSKLGRKKFKHTLANDPIRGTTFFYGMLPRQDVEMMLLHNGEFIVRLTGGINHRMQAVCISARYGDRVHHVLIRRNARGEAILEDTPFATVDQLVRYYVKKRKPLTKTSGVIIKKPVPRADWIVRNYQIREMSKVGEGNFGGVFKGLYTRQDKTIEEVAIKTLKGTNVKDEEKQEFFAECRRQRQLHHPHVVRFIGLVIDSDPPKMVMELCDYGLLDLLRQSGPPQDLVEKIRLSLHIIYGMEYLVEESIIHRDLAGRNCLIKSNVLKISDFGMARSGKVFKMSKKNVKLPLKWTAPDAIKLGIFSEKTDVWSFGVTMWELFSDGAIPYADLQQRHEEAFPAELLKFLAEGNRLPSPLHLDKDIYALMTDCWATEPSMRPSFKRIRIIMETIYAREGGTVSYTAPKKENYDDYESIL